MRRPSGFGDRRATKLRFIMALGIAGFALFSFVGSREFNPVTGEQQYVGMTVNQEMALGAKATPSMIQQYGGLYAGPADQELVDRVGQRLVEASAAANSAYVFDFHLLADTQTINAFALPGGNCFITKGLYRELKTEGQLAAVLGHEIVHVVAKHGAQRMSKQNLTRGLIGAVVAASGDQQSAQLAQTIGQMVNVQYGREDELESDRLGVRYMVDAGYDPSAMLAVMEILAKSRSGDSPAEFFSTHPNPENRMERIRSSISTLFPEGLPAGLTP